MITLKKYFTQNKKSVAYHFYTKINNNPLGYEKITREEIYNYVISSYVEDPEIILRLCSLEEINILKNLLEENLPRTNNGYIEYLLFQDLEANNLVFATDKEYYVPKDLINPLKMAMNLYQEEEYSLKDVTDSVLLGLMRIYNVLLVSDYLKYLSDYNIIFDRNSLINYFLNSLRLKDKLLIITYKNEEYVISLENPYYKDVLTLREIPDTRASYRLEELISYGKYKINLFEPEIFNFLSFLEAHLTPDYVSLIINDIIVYMGFRLNNPTLIHSITDNIKELEEAIYKVLPYFPIWIYNGQSLSYLKNYPKFEIPAEKYD